MRTLIASGHVQTSERQKLVQERDAAQRLYQQRPWDHGAEVAFVLADEYLRRFDQKAETRRPN